MTPESIIGQIEAAFAASKRPPNDALLHPDCHDSQDIEAFYAQTDWRSVPDELIAHENAALCFFSPKAFAYFLPAYLVWTLKNFKTSGFITSDNTIYALDPGFPTAELYDFAVSKYSDLDQAQRDAIVSFLTLMAENEIEVDAKAAKSALEHFWKKSVAPPRPI